MLRCLKQFPLKQKILNWLRRYLIGSVGPLSVTACIIFFDMVFSSSIKNRIAISFGLAHFSASVETSNFYKLGAKIKSFRFLEILCFVHPVEAVGKSPCHFQMLLLVFAYRNLYRHDELKCRQPLKKDM